MLRIAAVLIGIICLAGCRNPPVQEMSDARQAIAAARTAGATAGSPELDAATSAITRAEVHLEAREFTRARLAALQAKRHAAAALAGAQQQHGGTAPVPH